MNLKTLDYVFIVLIIGGFITDWIIYKKPPETTYILFFGILVTMFSMINEIRDLKENAKTKNKC